MEINYITTTFPHIPNTTRTLTDEEKFMIGFFMDDPEFEERVKLARQRAKIDENIQLPMSIVEKQNCSQLLEQTYKDKKEIYPAFQKIKSEVELTGIKDDLGILLAEGRSLCYTYHLPLHWQTSFAYFIAFGVLPIPANLGRFTLLAWNDPKRSLYENQKTVLIAIEENTSVDQLIKWLQQPYIRKELTIYLKQLPKSPYLNPANLQLYLKIAELDREGYKPKKIVELLRTKYKYNLDSTQVSRMKNKYKEFIQAVKKPLPL